MTPCQLDWGIILHYEPKTLKAWEEIVNHIFDESSDTAYQSLVIIRKGGEGQVSFVLCPDESYPFGASKAGRAGESRKTTYFM